MERAHDVLEFWFDTLEPDDWYKKSDTVDRLIKKRFEATYRRAIAGESPEWRETPEGRLAQVIVLDQLPRNMYRGTAAAYASDSFALAVAQDAVRAGDDRELEDTRRAFLYMPYMHSESRIVHEVAMELFADLPNLEFEVRHKAVIDRFGRYPHRNEALGRTSTGDERLWLEVNEGF